MFIQLWVFFYLLLSKAGNFVVEKPFLPPFVVSAIVGLYTGPLHWLWLYGASVAAWRYAECCTLVPSECEWTLWAEHYLTCPRPRSRMVYDGPIISWPMTRPEFRLDSHHHQPGSGGRGQLGMWWCQHRATAEIGSRDGFLMDSIYGHTRNIIIQTLKPSQDLKWKGLIKYFMFKQYMIS